MATKLLYVGNGSALYHVPARDLTDEDFAERAEIWAELGITENLLLQSGLYAKPEQVDTKKKQRGARQDAEKDGE